MSPEEREKEKNLPFIVATYVYASSQGQRTHSARTKIIIFVHDMAKVRIGTNQYQMVLYAQMSIPYVVFVWPCM